MSRQQSLCRRRFQSINRQLLFIYNSLVIQVFLLLNDINTIILNILYRFSARNLSTCVDSFEQMMELLFNIYVLKIWQKEILMTAGLIY